MAADCSFLDGFELYNDGVFHGFAFTPSPQAIKEISSFVGAPEDKLSGFTLSFDWREWTLRQGDYVNHLTLHCLTSDGKEISSSLKKTTLQSLRAEAYEALLARMRRFNPLDLRF